MTEAAKKSKWSPRPTTIAIFVFVAAVQFLVPDSWVHWTCGIAFGITCFAILLLDKDREKPGFEAVLILVAGGAFVFSYGASAFPRDALFSYRQLMKIDFTSARFIWGGAGMVLGGVLWAVWLTVLRTARMLGPKEPNKRSVGKLK
jgi:hypothetical protein